MQIPRKAGKTLIAEVTCLIDSLTAVKDGSQ